MPTEKLEKRACFFEGFAAGLILALFVTLFIMTARGWKKEKPESPAKPFFVNGHGQQFVRVSPYDIESWLKGHPNAKITTIAGKHGRDYVIIYEEPE